MPTEPPLNETPNDPAFSSSTPIELDPSEWRHALVPWKEGGKPYTYLIPPGMGMEPGDWCLVERPNGSFAMYQVAGVEPHEPTMFQLKPLAAAWSAATHAEMIRKSEDAGEPPIKIDPHPDYPRWKAEAADMFVEGR